MADDVMDKVIDGGFCIGCGACAFAAPRDFRMTFTELGHWKAERIGSGGDGMARICPMSGEGPNETAIAASLYPDLPVHPTVGRHLACGAGWVEEGDHRAAGGSGGLLTWLLVRLLDEDLVDAVLHVRPRAGEAQGSPLFEYRVSSDREAVRAGAKSRYHPIEMSEVLGIVRDSDARFAVVGLPCFLKAVRRLQLEGLLPRRRTPFLVGLICGHLKSAFFAELLAWQKDVPPEALEGMDFRVKLRDRPASEYAFEVVSRRPDGAREAAVHPMSSVLGRDWGQGLLKNFACEFCDDVIAECADVAIGDAWLPGYVEDPRGANVFVARHAVLRDLIERGAADGALRVDPATPDVVAQSQGAGIRHRREGLAHRLSRMARDGRWTPKKRCAPEEARAPNRRAIYDRRLEIAAISDRLFARARLEGDLGLFLREIRPLLLRYREAYGVPPLRKRIVGRLRRAARDLLKAPDRLA